MEASPTASSPVRRSKELGQSIWYDNIRRSLLTSGELARMVEVDGLGGVTSNPSIFAKAIVGSTDYDEALIEARAYGALDAKSLYEALAFADVSGAADVLRSTYEESQGVDGYVSVEVPPALAYDTAGTVAEAIRIWGTIDRANLMVKVPATPEGIPAIQALIGRGINVNVTLLFSVDTYAQVAEAYLAGLEDRLAGGGEISGLASVASFFVSRIDSAVDGRLSDKLRGKVAIANAKLAYARFQELSTSKRWQVLVEKGARPQRLLWASTSTKDPAYPELYYVESLIGADTVDTVPPATYEEFRAHGRPQATLNEGLDGARKTLEALAGEGVDMDQVTDQLLIDGVKSFQDAFHQLLASFEGGGTERIGTKSSRLTRWLDDELELQLQEIRGEWLETNKVGRIWARDPHVWTGSDEERWLGWLSVALDQMAHPHRFMALVKDVTAAGFTDAVVLGMGGSSLCPEVMSRTFDPKVGLPTLHVLDSTDPAQIRSVEERVNLASTLFFVSSKSGSTLEPNIYADYFVARVREAVGEVEASSHFIAITDPGSSLAERAKREGWRGVFYGIASIGGRYSGLSDFGMIPGASCGVDVMRLFDSADTMAHSCAASVPLIDNPGFDLGAVIGVCAKAGRDKLTLVVSKKIASFGAWLEQLLAESTGKDNRGVIPVDLEPLGSPSVYGNDRLFVQLRLRSEPDSEVDKKVEAIAKAGHPVYRIDLDDPYDLGGEMFRWEFATATAGSILGINPFNQPDVEDAKLATLALTKAYEDSGSLPEMSALYDGDDVVLFASDENEVQLMSVAGKQPSLESYLGAHLGRVAVGDYVALLAYVEMNSEHQELLTQMRSLIRDRYKVATCVGFGPRFQHSTGQAYKGGPNSGVFIQITCDEREDLAIPGRSYTFGVVKEAQARGDLEVLADRGRRALRIHLGADVTKGLKALVDVVAQIVQR